MSNQQKSYDTNQTQGLVRGALVTALYIALTMVVAPVAYGPIQFRISEALNFIGLYNRRYIYSITLGVMIVNFLQSNLLDVVVGGVHTLISLLIARWLGEKVVQWMGEKAKHPLFVRYIVMTFVFTATMFIIAWMLIHLGYENYFWQTYGVLALSEFIVMTLGGLVMYFLIDPRINFYQ